MCKGMQSTCMPISIHVHVLYEPSITLESHLNLSFKIVSWHSVIYNVHVHVYIFLNIY